MKKRKNDMAISLRAFFTVGEKTKHSIFSIFAFLVASFLILASVGKAGPLGNNIYAGFVFLFGLGYFLFPLIFLFFGIILIQTKRPLFLLSSVTGGVLFFLSGLGIVATIRGDGGVVGSLLSSPLVSLLDFYATVIILSGVFIISLLLLFDAALSFEWLWRIKHLFKKSGSENPIIIGPIQKDSGKTKALGGSAVTEEVADSTGHKPISDKEQTTETIQGRDAKEGVLDDIFIFGKKSKESSYPLFSDETQGKYTPPPLALLGNDKGKPGYGDIKANSNIIKRTLQNFGINVEMDEVSVGPSVTRYALKPAQGIKLSRIVGLQNDLSLALAAHPIRIEAPIPGRSLVGIEIPNSSRTTVGLSSLLDTEEFLSSKLPLLISIGRDITGKPHFGNLNKMPHLLIAGATGSGKSVAIHTIITSILYRNSPSHLRFIMIDPKRVELTLYNKIPHLLTPVITDSKKAILALKWAAREMERRYDILETEAVRDIESYHGHLSKNTKNKIEEMAAIEKTNNETEGVAKNTGEELSSQMPYIIIIIDELADIMSTYPRELEAAIVRLAQMSRAVGIHLVLSTQRPSVNVITGLIKANIPARMAFQVTSQTDSRTILDMGGAEKLLGAGDMLYVSGEMSKPVRLQSAFISEGEIKKITAFLSKHYDESPVDLSITDNSLEKSELFDGVEDEPAIGDDDDLYEAARETVIKTGKASTTFLQRRLRVGYARAARLMDMLEERGIVSAGEGAKPRDVLEKDEGYGSVDQERD